MPTTLLSANSLNVTRQGSVVLKDVTLEVGQHDFITIVGPNGAGKSMLLKCLMGFYQPDSGNIERKAGLRVGYVPQRIFPDHTMPISVRRFLQLRRSQCTTNMESMAYEAGISTIMEKMLHVLSGGELQRVLLARALLNNPHMLILDEPAQNLDVAGQLAFYKLLEKLYSERDLSILMVSHDLHMVMASTRRVVCLFRHICCSGEPHVVTRDPEFISLFGRDMARMMAVYQHSHNHSHVHSGECAHD